MKPAYRKITFAIVVLIIGMCSCKKNDNGVYFNADFKKYFDYQVASYWVFYDSLNNNVDSFFVFTDNNQQPAVSPDGKETQYIDIRNILNSQEFGLILTAPYTSQIHIGNFTDSDISYSPFTYKMPFDTSGQLISNGGIYTYTFYPLYINNYSVYENVYKIDIIKNHSHDIFYINADAGFIEILLNNNIFVQKLYIINYSIIK